MLKAFSFALALVVSAPCFADQAPQPDRRSIVIIQQGNAMGFRYCEPGAADCSQIGYKEFYSRSELKAKRDRAVRNAVFSTSPVGMLTMAAGLSAAEYRAVVISKNPQDLVPQCIPTLRNAVKITIARLVDWTDRTFNPATATRQADLTNRILRADHDIAVDRAELERLLNGI
jgi:hypothetical protein